MKKITRRLIQTLPVAAMMMACMPAAAQTITLFNSSDGARIPAIAKLANGTLMAVSDKRYSGYGDIGSNVIDLVARFGGVSGGYGTWQDAVTIAAGSSSASGFDYAHGDAAIVADRESSSAKVLIMAASGNVSISNSKVIGTKSYSGQTPSYSYSVEGAIRIGRYVSDNLGGSWTGTDVTENIYSLFEDATTGSYSGRGNTKTAELSPKGLFFSSGRICQSSQIKVGSYYRIYAALVAYPTSSCGVLVVYSDDFGETWNALGGSSARPCVGGDESKIEELPNGNVLLSSKYGTSRYFNIFTYSSTPTASGEAEGEWGTAAASDITTAACNGEILIVPAKDSEGNGLYVALQSVPASENRENVSIYYKLLTSTKSYDEVSDFTSGWKLGKQVSSTTSAYSTMTLDHDGNIAFLYEEDYDSNTSGCYNIKFVSLSLSDIVGEGYEYYAGMTEDQLSTTEVITDPADIRYWVGKVFTLKVHFNIDNTDSYHYLSCDYDETSQQPKFAFTSSDDVTAFDKTYYWTISENKDDLDGDGTVEDHYYISAIAGTGYWGTGTGINFYTKKSSNNVPMCSEDYTKEFKILSLEKNWGETDHQTTLQTLVGYAFKFNCTDYSENPYRVVAFDEQGDINWLDGTTYGAITSLSGTTYHWSTDFILEEVDYVAAENETEAFGSVSDPQWNGFPVKMYRHYDSYTAKDGENYNYYAMLKLPFATKLPDGVKAYNVSSLSQTANTVVSLTELELTDNVLPRETPVLLCMDGAQNDGDADCIKTIFLPLADAQAIISTGFGGVLGKKVYKSGDEDLYDNYIANKKFYILGNKSGRVAFYWLNFSDGQATVPANKGYYLYTGTSQSALGFTFDDDVTGISLPVSVETAADDDAPVYDLMGRRISAPVKGVYIKGGKKYVVK